jgi:predicted nuclease of predicted toxin-antitoxin system
MRTLLCDADVPAQVIEVIRALRIPVQSIMDIPGAIQDDQRVIDVAKTFDAIIIALDKDYTTSKPLFAAMVEQGSRVVILRFPKCKPNEIVEKLAILILENHRQWQNLLDAEPGVVSCSQNGNRLKRLRDFPWFKELGK